MRFIRILIKTAASIKLTVFCLLLISILVVCGTFYQVDFGVYAAQKRFFDSWLFFISGIVPFPGVKSIIAVLTLNLIASGVFRFSFRLERTGILLMHVGTAILIAGTGFSSFLIKESVISLYEGDMSAVSMDYNEWEIAFFKKEKGNLKRECFYNFNSLKQGQKISFSSNGISGLIDRLYSNCSAYGTSPHIIDSLQPKVKENNREGNIPGLILSVTQNGTEGIRNAKIVLYGGTGAPAHCVIGNDTLLASLQPCHFKLPIQLKLIDFSKEDHPGTKTAKSFKSRIHVTGLKLDREVVISMNRPFRYKAFTFYQTGYSMESGRESTTLSVVENPVRFVPYITGLIIMLGLFFHFIYKFMVDGLNLRRK